jgi:hypothetical protein
MEPIKPEVDPNEFKTAAPEQVTPLLLAFRDGSYFKEDVLDEQDTD